MSIPAYLPTYLPACLPISSSTASHLIFPSHPLITHRSGQYYGIAAATGKIGAFAGSYALNAIQVAAGSDRIAAGRNPFFVASALAFLAGGLVLLLPHIGQDTIDTEDVAFREYLTSHGYDTSKMGLVGVEVEGGAAESEENVNVAVATKEGDAGV